MEFITGKEILPPRIIYYAVPGFGKTTFASKFPSPLLVRTEDGGRNIAVTKTKALETFFEFKDVIEYLIEEKHEHKTLVIDTLDQLELLINKDVCAEHGKADMGEIGFGRGEKRTAAHISEMLGKLDYLNREKGMIILMLAHCVISEVKDPINEPYSRFRINVNEKYVLPEIERWADCVFFGNYKIRTKEVKQVTGKKVNRPVGEYDERVLHTEGRPSYLAKNRYALPAQIPLSSDLEGVGDDVRKLLSLIKQNITN